VRSQTQMGGGSTGLVAEACRARAQGKCLHAAAAGIKHGQAWHIIHRWSTQQILRWEPHHPCLLYSSFAFLLCRR
jgi:hypothetical protein